LEKKARATNSHLYFCSPNKEKLKKNRMCEYWAKNRGANIMPRLFFGILTKQGCADGKMPRKSL
jgi:hypothetical protein